MCLGSNGEFRALDDEESLKVIRLFSENRGADKGLIAGIGRESLYQTLKMIDRVCENGIKVDYFSVLTPHYFKKKMTDTALVEYFTAIADHSPVPVLLYCAPGFANGVCVSREALLAVADHPNIAGIKDTSTDMMDTYMDAVGGREDFEVMAGSINTLYHCLQRGGRGGVISAANYFPQECAQLTKLWAQKGEEGFKPYYDELLAKVKATGAKGGISGVKCCMNLLGFRAGVPRKPVQPLTQAEQAEIAAILK